MGPVSGKLQAAKGISTESLLEIMVEEELDDLKQKYNRLGIEGKEKFENILGGIDTYDVLETSTAARDFLNTLSDD